MSGPRVAAVVNPQSGGASDEDTLRAGFAASGVDVEWLPTTADDPGLGQAAGAVRRGIPTVVACGGDGTVRAVLQSVAGTDAVLGIVPLGTGNLLAANLGLPKGVDAVPVAVSGETTRIDVGTVNGERFAVMAGIGFDAMMIRDANPALKKRLGSVAYVFSAARHLRSKVFTAAVEIDGLSRWQGRTVMVLAGNCGTVSGGLEVFPDAANDDGVLDVAVLTARGARQWAAVVWRLLRGRQQRADRVTRLRGARVVVRTSRAMPYQLDGEVRDPTTQLSLGVERRALSVRIPG
jgi:YegS/Rv2252/BmrU family lipid kinase